MADVRRIVREWAAENADSSTRYLVAVSGGGDSLALAWAIAQEAPGLGLAAGAVVVDHQLQEGSTQRSHDAAERLSGWGLGPVIIKQVEVGSSGGPEDAARTARYQAFSEAMKETGAGGILLAHTKDDQAETVLLGMARGSGPSGLKGMAESDGAFHRPLLGTSRDTLRQALVDAGVDWWEDPHNSDERFTRSRVREAIMPLLEKELGPGVADSLARTAALFRQDSEALDAIAASACETLVDSTTAGTRSVDVAELLDHDPAISSRILRMMVTGVGGIAPTFAQMKQVESVLWRWKGQSSLDLSGASLERLEGSIVVRSAGNRPTKGTQRGL